MSTVVADLVRELPKSKLPAGSAVDGGEFVFFVSGPKPLLCDVAIQDGEALVLSTGGNAAVHIGRKQFSYSTDCWALEPIASKVSGEFLYQYIRFKIDHIDTFGFEGSGLRHLKKEFLRKYPVPEFAKPEQTKIAEVLSTVDRAIEQTEALIAKQQRIKTGLMQDLLTRGIDEHGNLRSEQTHEFKDSPLGRIPVEWEVCKLKNIGFWSSGGTPSKANPEYWGDEVAWVCPKDMKTFDLYSTIEGLTKIGVRYGSKMMPPETVFIVVRGMILAHTFPVCIAGRPMAFNQDIKAIVVNPSIEPRFFAYWLSDRGSALLKITTTATHGTKRFDMSELFEIAIGIPEKNEQGKIVNMIDTLQAQITSNKKKNSKHRSLKTALMQDLLTGKKRITALLNDTEGT